jgi:pimeloyl-ACP methyl ester carboxylesterase
MSTWILLRGLTRESAHWGDFPTVLQQALPEAHTVTLDLPGNGRRHHEASPATVAGMVAACRAEVVRQGIAKPVHLLAMSLGAMVAAEWACVAPGEVAACVLINTSVRPFSPFYQRLRPHNLPSLLRFALGGMTPEAAERTVLRLTSNHTDRHEAVIKAWVTARTQRPVSPRNALRQLLAAARYRAPQQAPAVPLLLLASQHDHLVDSRCSMALAAAWRCPLDMHPSAGHDLPLDDPQWAAQRVLGWLAGQVPAGG